MAAVANWLVVLVDDDGSASHYINVRMPAQMLDLARETLRVHDVIVVHAREKLTSGEIQNLIQPSGKT
jgi:hypothetical protein